MSSEMEADRNKQVPPGYMQRFHVLALFNILSEFSGAAAGTCRTATPDPEAAGGMQAFLARHTHMQYSNPENSRKEQTGNRK